MNTLKRILVQIRGLFPEALPVGVTAFNTLVKSIMDNYTLPTQDEDSVRFAIASTVMRFGPTKAYCSKLYFVTVIKAGCAKQVAGASFQDIKERQKAAYEAAKLAEATQKVDSADVPPEATQQ